MGVYLVPHEVLDGSIGNTIRKEQCNQEDTDEPGPVVHSSSSQSEEYCPGGESDSILSDQSLLITPEMERLDKAHASSSLNQC